MHYAKVAEHHKLLVELEIVPHVLSLDRDIENEVVLENACDLDEIICVMPDAPDYECPYYHTTEQGRLALRCFRAASLITCR